jgi:putative hemolysin
MNEGEHEFDNGFVLHELEHIPLPQAKNFEWRDFTLEIIDMDGQRIDKILVVVSELKKEEMED